MKFSTKMFYLSYLPNIPASFIYIYLSTTFLYDFPYLYVALSMFLSFTIIAVIIKRSSLPIDASINEFENNGSISLESEYKLKKTHSLLSSLIPKLFIIFIAISYYLIAIFVLGEKLFFFLNISSFADFGHIVALFTTSFITLGLILENQIGLIRSKIGITSIKGDSIYKIRLRMTILVISIISSIGLSITYYYETMMIRSVAGKEELESLFENMHNLENIEKIERLETFILSEKQSLKLTSLEYENLGEELNILKKNPTEDGITNLSLKINPFISNIKQYKDIRRSISGDQVFIVTLLLMYAIFAVIITYILSHGITNQMNIINNNIDKMLKKKKVNYEPLPIISRTEVSFLTDKFNKLLSRLNRQNEELEGFYENMELKVKEKTDELHHSNKINAGISVLSPGLYRKEGIRGITEQTLEQLHKIFGPNFKFAIYLEDSKTFHFSDYDEDEQNAISSYINSRLWEKEGESIELTLPGNTMILPILTGEQDHRSGIMFIKSDSNTSVDITTNIFLEQIANFIEIDTLHRKLQKMAETDPLTGAYNRGQFEKIFQKSVVSKFKHGKNFTLVYGDINRLKYINDNLGHLAGDSVIKRSVSLFEKLCSSKENSVYRLGGDELAMICRNSNSEADKNILTKLEQSIEEAEIKLGNNKVPLHISFGLINSAEFNNDNISKEDYKDTMFKAAEERMENNKKSWYEDMNLNRRK